MLKKPFLMLVGMLFGLGVFAGTPSSMPVPPNEGMWLPHLIKTLNFAEMQQMGFKLTADDIYSVNKSCLKDAVVQMGGFCTAEVVSPEGLLFTNHHCGYDAIATQSSVEHDYLTNGFWAMSKDQELPNEGLNVSFLQRIESVTDRINKAVEGLSEEEAEAKREEEIGKIEEEAAEGELFRAEVKSMFNGNEYMLMVYEVFNDIRLVGAPPSSIGKFGGDTDNWMWPRQTGDFSIFRVYANKENKPAEYSEDNVPYKPKHFLPISIKGLNEGDFAMTMGYPGSTDRYLSSYAIDFQYKNSNPLIVKILGERLRIMKADMDADPKVRIMMASNYASLANTYKYFLGQNRGLDRRGLIEEREAMEKQFTNWVNADQGRKAKYGQVLSQFKENYEKSKDVLKLSSYINMAAFAPGLVTYGIGYWRLTRALDDKEKDKSKAQPQLDALSAGLEAHFKEYNLHTDQNIFSRMTEFLHTDLPAGMQPAAFKGKTFTKAKAKGDMTRFDSYAASVFKNSMLVSEAKCKAFLENPSKKALEADPGVEFISSIIDLYRSQLAVGQGMFDAVNGANMMAYEAGLHEMNTGKKYYPDANFTMRVSYGKMIPYDPRDGVSYKAYTYADGILEKEVKGDEEFDVPTKLHDLLAAKDYGRYGKNGKLPVCFLTDNDITGGNSGSPVINGSGQLIGLAFDGNWESMTGDLVYDPGVQRTISVDIRYVLFVIEKYAGATNLIKELTIVE
jgi:Peptidase S46